MNVVKDVNVLGAVVYLFIVTFCASGCSNNTIVIDTDFPAPLVKQLPLTIGIVYEEDFRNHHYEEDSEVLGERDWVLDTGRAQVLLFNQLLAAIFEHIVVLDEFPSEIPSNVDAVFSPLVEDLQIAIPKVTKINVFEVWIRYNLRIYTPEGEVIADWIMSGYGKTPTRFLKTQAQAIEQATVLALRDGGANFVIGFNKVPEVRRWLESEKVIEAAGK